MKATVLAAALVLFAGGAFAKEDPWAGFYAGLDHEDGSYDMMTIVPLGDGTYRMTTRSDGHALCKSEGELQAGLVQGTGVVEGDRLVRRDTTLTCEGQAPVAMDDFPFTKEPWGNVISSVAPAHDMKLMWFKISK